MFEVENRQPNFNQFPVIEYKDINSFGGYTKVTNKIKQEIKKIDKKKRIVVFDCFFGVDTKSVKENIIDKLGADLVINVEDAKLSEEITAEKFKKFIVPDDRAYGVFAVGTMDEFFCEDKINELKNNIRKAKGLVVVYGVAAGLLADGDLNIYCNVAYDKYAERLARGLDNWGAGNYNEEPLRKQKRMMFLEQPMMEKYKINKMTSADFICDFSDAETPVLLKNDDFKKIIRRLCKRPYQLTPGFTKAIWGGHWAQKVLGVHPEWENIGWVMTGHMNFMHIDFIIGGNKLPIFGLDAIYYEPKKLLGGSIYYKWGYRCPITTNYLDTWGGGNLSLQVHSIASYGQMTLNARAGHHESYYMMDTTDHSSVYLGLKKGTKVKDMVADLNKAQKTAKFDDTKYINKIPMKKHQHVFIPGGTVHCSGEGTCVLEIDQYTYATFKLWDWGRVDYDGLPRPININHGQYCIQEDFNGEFVYDRLIAKQPEIARGDGWRLEDSSSIEYEPMDIKRYWFKKPVHIECNDAIAILVLVEGEEAVVESVDGSFDPFVIHYGESTFIPAEVGQYIVKPYGKSEGEELALIKVTYPSKA